MYTDVYNKCIILRCISCSIICMCYRLCMRVYVDTTEFMTSYYDLVIKL
nr:MAG TPA: hypothetical protein [Caudoviricetes sp.]